MRIKLPLGTLTTRMQARIGLIRSGCLVLYDGFDVVIGNPPYVRQEKIKELQASAERINTTVTPALPISMSIFMSAVFRCSGTMVS